MVFIGLAAEIWSIWFNVPYGYNRPGENSKSTASSKNWKTRITCFINVDQELNDLSRVS